MNSRKELRKIKIGVYQLTPNNNNNTCNFVEKGYVRYGKTFDDEVINLNFLKDIEYKYKIEGDRVKYNDEIYFQFFKDNLASTYISKTSKIPIFHCSVMYQKKILMGNLLNIYLYFNINNAKSFTSFKQLTESNLKGTWELEIESNDRKTTLPFEQFVSYEDLITDLLDILASDTMKTMIEDEMINKDELRIKQYGKVDDFKIPDKVINFNDLVKKYEDSQGNSSVIEDVYNNY